MESWMILDWNIELKWMGKQWRSKKFKHVGEKQVKPYFKIMIWIFTQGGAFHNNLSSLQY